MCPQSGYRKTAPGASTPGGLVDAVGRVLPRRRRRRPLRLELDDDRPHRLLADLPGVVLGPAGDELELQPLVDPDGPLIVAQDVGRQGERELRRPGATIAPGEPVGAVVPEVVAGVERPHPLGAGYHLDDEPAARRPLRPAKVPLLHRASSLGGVLGYGPPGDR